MAFDPEHPVLFAVRADHMDANRVTGMRLDPAGTVTRVQGIRYPLLRANLLLSAVDAISSRRNLRGSPARVVDSAVSTEIRRSLSSNAATPAAKPPE